ncbi:MAG: hydroxymethylbilane synthase [Bacteroidota bacterium]
MNPVLKIATRGSDLALWQANHIASKLNAIGLKTELKIIKTQGDKIQHLSLEKLEGKGFFTKEIEDALLNNEADLAVHSHKDLPTEPHPDLIIAAVSDREDPSELLLIRKESVDVKQKLSLKKNAIVGTSSSRRKSQLLAFRKDIELKDLRGNVPTRIDKLRKENYDAILIAAAGVERLELDISDLHAEKLNPKEFVPAPAQGVLAIQIRKGEKELWTKLQSINQSSVAMQIGVERKVLTLFHGGCQMPVGAYCEYDEDKEVFKAWVSKSTTWDQLPVGIYVESKNQESLAEKIVAKIKSIKPTRVFISRNPRKDDYFQHVLSHHGFSVEGKSLIEMNSIPIRSVPVTDWIFFSSKNAVTFFFLQKPELGDQKFGCIGKSTAEAIRKYGKRADFIGYSTDTKMTGKQFASRVGSGTVLFPMAKGSMRSIQNGFVKSGQTIDLTVYETLKTDVQIQVSDFDIFLFTSPSNVEAFFEKNRLTNSHKVIAMGDATASSLKKFGIFHPTVPEGFDDVSLSRAVFGVSSI